ncbi:putative methyl-accepting chemotaxis protein YoaH [compost metagenome]
MLEMNKSTKESIQLITEGAYSQTQGAEDSARAMEEIANGIHQVSATALTVSDSAVSALETALSGKNALSKMKVQVNQISIGTIEALTMVAALKEQSQQIEGVLHAITEFSEQTKLLALNAAIEAARAGEHGKGFAVVASEVRKLAEASSASVLSIATLLHSIQRESVRIGDKMDDSADQIQAGVILTQQAEQSFDHVVDIFSQVSHQIQEVSAAAEEMSAGSEEVSASVHSMAIIAKEVSVQTTHMYELTNQQIEMMQHVADASTALSRMSHEVKLAVLQVKV